MIDNEVIRRVTQVASFLPVLVAYFMLRPQAFAGSVPMQLSSSQAIGLASVAVCGFYVVFDKAAREHPEAAMALDLPEPEPVSVPEKSAPAEASDSAPAEASDSGEAAEEPAPEPPAAKKATKKKKQRKRA
jgi:hypothetical protein